MLQCILMSAFGQERAFAQHGTRARSIYFHPQPQSTLVPRERFHRTKEPPVLRSFFGAKWHWEIERAGDFWGTSRGDTGIAACDSLDLSALCMVPTTRQL